MPPFMYFYVPEIFVLVMVNDWLQSNSYWKGNNCKKQYQSCYKTLSTFSAVLSQTPVFVHALLSHPQEKIPELASFETNPRLF